MFPSYATKQAYELKHIALMLLIHSVHNLNHMWITNLGKNARFPPNVESMSGHRRRRWPNIEPALGKHIVIAGIPAQLKQLDTM